MEELCAFFSVIHPQHDSNVKQVSFLNKDDDATFRKFVITKHFRTQDELVNYFKAKLDAPLVYHACGVFSGKNRTKESSAGASSVWLDLDVRRTGDNHHTYEELSHCLAKVEATLSSALLVWSGGGIHAYWPLTEHLDPKEWVVVANKLYHLSRKEGLKQDASRTRDIASVLRVPSALNEKYKSVNTIVQWPEHVLNTSLLAEVPGSNQTILPRSQHQPLNIEDVLHICGQLKGLRETANQDYKTWFGCATVCKHAKGGEDYFHEFSRNDPRYKREQAQQKLDSSSYVQSCETFEEQNPEGCQSCPFRGKGLDPISATARSTALETITNVNGHIPPLPEYFSSKGSDLYLASTKNGKAGQVKVCFPIFWASSMAEDEETKKKYVRWSWRDNNSDEPKSILLRQSESQGVGMLKNLGDYFWCADHTAFHRYLTASQGLYRELCEEQERVTHMPLIKSLGWTRSTKDKELGFKFGHDLMTKDRVYNTVIDDSSEDMKRISYGMHMAVDDAKQEWVQLEKWVTLAHEWLSDSRTNNAARMALLTSFIAPLCYFLHELGFYGITVHSYGETSGGKSQALKAAAGVWGSFSALNLSAESSYASAMRLLMMRPNIPFIIDEIHKSTAFGTDAEHIHSLAKQVTAGQIGARATLNGEIRAGKREFSTIVQTAGNASLIARARELSVQADATAVEKRIVEFLADSIEEANIGEAGPYETLGNYSGGAGRLLLRHVMQPGVIERLREWVRDYRLDGFSRADRFIVAYIALCEWTANELRSMPYYLPHENIKVHGLINFHPSLLQWLKDSQLANVEETTQVSSLGTLERGIIDFINTNRHRTVVYEKGVPSGREDYPPDDLPPCWHNRTACIAHDVPLDAYIIEPSEIRAYFKRAGDKSNVDAKLRRLMKQQLISIKRARILGRYEVSNEPKYVFPVSTLANWGEIDFAGGEEYGHSGD
jgi:hypothetical protein